MLPLSRRAVLVWSVLLLVVSIAVVFASVVHARRAGETVLAQVRPPFDAAAAEYQLRPRLEQALLRAGHDEWSGVYTYWDGENSSRTLLLVPGSGFIARQNSEGLGEGDLLRLGSAQWRDGRIELHDDYVAPAWPLLPQTLSSSLIPLRWGERRYLVGADQLARFARAVNFSGSEAYAAQNGAALRRGDETRPVSGLPPLPAAAQAYLRSQPLLLHVTSVDIVHNEIIDGGFQDVRRIDYRLTLSAGDGIVAGMQLQRDFSSVFDAAEFITIEQVDANAATAAYSDIVTPVGFLETRFRPDPARMDRPTRAELHGPRIGDVWSTGGSALVAMRGRR